MVKELATTSNAQMHRSKKLWNEDAKVSKEKVERNAMLNKQEVSTMEA